MPIPPKATDHWYPIWAKHNIGVCAKLGPNGYEAVARMFTKEQIAISLQPKYQRSANDEQF